MLCLCPPIYKPTFSKRAKSKKEFILSSLYWVYIEFILSEVLYNNVRVHVHVCIMTVIYTLFCPLDREKQEGRRLRKRGKKNATWPLEWDEGRRSGHATSRACCHGDDN